MESLVKEGVQKKKAKTFFVCFVKRKKKSSLFLSKRRTDLFAEVFEESYEKSMEVRSLFFVLPSTCSSLVFVSGLFEVIFYHQHHNLSRFLTCSSLLTAQGECTAEQGRTG